jgi:ATP/maltotriose-dependent transcriptional regulator MalT/DNA-binding SARP family transcriptional activator
MSTRRAVPTRAAPERAAAKRAADELAEAAAATPVAPAPHKRRSTPALPPVKLGPIIKSKIQPPVLRATTLSRQRLVDRLQEAVRGRLTLVTAEAGYGKTTLLADFASQSGIRTLWYRLDSTDADVITWTNHIIAAVREMEPNFGEATLRLMTELATGGPPKSAFVSSVVAELGSLDAQPTVLVLDDFHEVDSSADAVDFVQRLLKDGPPWLSILIAARHRPDIEVARLKASGDVAELTTEDLRFSLEETTRLFAERFETPLEDDVIEDLDKRTKGWIASLQLFYGSIRDRPPSAVRALAHALSGAANPIYDFLAEEVLASLPEEIYNFVVRASILNRIDTVSVASLFDDVATGSIERVVERWIDESDRLALLSRSSQSTTARHFHPLLREFLLKLLQQRFASSEIAGMHRRVAFAFDGVDPLMASHHYFESGDEQSAMRCLDDSLMLMIGSGQWGMAADLIERMNETTASPAVAIIRARRLVEEARFEEASVLLERVDISRADREVRAAIRQTKLSLGWRSANPDLLFDTLAQIDRDEETPQVLRDIAGIYVDASTLVARPAPLPVLARRLQEMADNQRNDGHRYYAAISLHNAAVASLNAGDYGKVAELGAAAIAEFGCLPFFAYHQLSTHSVIAIAEFERGNTDRAEAEMSAALRTGEEFADVPAELSYTKTVMGENDKAADLLVRANILRQQARSDLVADALTDAASAVSLFRSDVQQAIGLLESEGPNTPLDFGYTIARDVALAQALLLAGNRDRALLVAQNALDIARDRLARGAQVRLGILIAVLRQDRRAVEKALIEAESVGQLAIAELADVLASDLELIQPVPAAVERSIRSFPKRWLPLLRRHLQTGPTPAARIAAAALDQFGTADDIGLLRAFAKTYAKRGVPRTLGLTLTRRVSPQLEIRDLGRVSLVIGARTVHLTSMRRKPASVLMYLVTRPGFAANREQVVDELWPDADATSGTNNLNQSLYFLRREIDPWYEDDVSVDYVGFHGELVWLDPELVVAQSVEFVRSAALAGTDLHAAAELLSRYEGAFGPEFEYEEWSIPWRTRVHSTFLEAANATIDRGVIAGDYKLGAQVASHVVRVDPSAADIERRLVWLYGRLGLHSAARAQYEHLLRADEADGLESAPLATLLDGPLPDG